MLPKAKYYLYVDETGQHTRGQSFVVSVVVVEAGQRERLESSLLEAESASGKGLSKWVSLSPSRRVTYLDSIVPILRELAPCYYRLYGAGTDYLPRTVEAIVAAIQHRQFPEGSVITVVIDGLNIAERQQIGRLLRSHTLPYSRTVRGGRDESNPYIRLADALAGFFRHRELGQPYTEALSALAPFFQEI